MTLPLSTPPNPTPISQRCHADPPQLWVKIAVGSCAIHIVTFGLLYPFLTGQFSGGQSQTNLIPVDLIAVKSEVKSPSPRLQLPYQKTAPGTAKSAMAHTSRPQRLTQPSANPAVNPKPVSTSSQSSRNTQVHPTGKPSPTQTSTSKGSSTKVSPQPSANSSPPNSSSSPTSPTSSPQTEVGGGMRASIGGLRLTDTRRDIPTQLARLRPDSLTQVSIDDLNSLGINPKQVMVLKVKVFIESSGQASVLPGFTQILSGTLTEEQAEQLTRQLIATWQFEPTYMANEPVDQTYDLELSIRPPSD